MTYFFHIEQASRLDDFPSSLKVCNPEPWLPPPSPDEAPWVAQEREDEKLEPWERLRNMYVHRLHAVCPGTLANPACIWHKTKEEEKAFWMKRIAEERRFAEDVQRRQDAREKEQARQGEPTKDCELQRTFTVTKRSLDEALMQPMPREALLA